MSFTMFKKYHAYFSMAISSILIASCFFLTQCKDDEAIASAVVSITNPAAHDTVWNTVTVQAKVINDPRVKLKKAELFVDNILSGTLTAIPAGNTFLEFSWNSTLVADGVHTLKVRITDRSGNQASTSIKIIVANTLVTIPIGAKQRLLEYQRGFVFLSDEQGNLIASAEYTDGPFELKSPSFNGKSFYLTEVRLSESVVVDGYTSPNSLYLYTYPGIERGRIWNLRGSSDPTPSAGEASLTFSNLESGFRYSHYTSGGSSNVGAPLALSLKMAKTSGKLLSVKFKSDASNRPLFKLFSPVQTGSNPVIDLSEVNEECSFFSAELPASGYVYYDLDLTAYPQVNDYSEPYRLQFARNKAIKTGATVEFPYPGNAFPSYYSVSSYEYNGVVFESGRSNALCNFTPFPYDVTFDLDPKVIGYSATGNFAIASANYYVHLANGSAEWSFILPRGIGRTVHVPVLPSALAGYFDLDATNGMQSYSMFELEGIDSYAQLKDRIGTSSFGFADFTEVGRNYTVMSIWPYPESEEGRKAAPRTSR
jgi:hypothetical protein